MKKNLWKEGKMIDLWSINHTLSGAVLASIFILLKLNFLPSIIISIALMVGWEIFEYLTGIEEKTPNKIMDVLTGIIGFVVANYLINYGKVKIEIFFPIILITFITLELLGYFAYKKNKTKY